MIFGFMNDDNEGDDDGDDDGDDAGDDDGDDDATMMTRRRWRC